MRAGDLPSKWLELQYQIMFQLEREFNGSHALTKVADEKFVAQGLIITERNYLEVYIYDRWSDKEIPEYSVGETFDPASIDLNEGETTAPPLLSEADLISLMVSFRSGRYWSRWVSSTETYNPGYEANVLVGIQNSPN